MKKCLILGDSSMFQGPSSPHAVGPIIKAKLAGMVDITLFNRNTHSSTILLGALQELNALSQPVHYDVVVACAAPWDAICANHQYGDLWQACKYYPISLPQVEIEMRKLTDRILWRGSYPLEAPGNEQLNECSHWLDFMAKSFMDMRGNSYLDIREPLLAQFPSGFTLPDGVHFTQVAGELVGRLVSNSILQILGSTFRVV